jgi:prepilin-type processing-associated H-X9-DG protein
MKPGAGWAYDSYSKADSIAGGLWANQAFMKDIQIPVPSMTMVFIEEADSRSYNNGTWVFSTSPVSWVDTFAVFHGNNSSFSFADGHAESHKWLEGQHNQGGSRFSQWNQQFLLERRFSELKSGHALDLRPLSPLELDAIAVMAGGPACQRARADLPTQTSLHRFEHTGYAAFSATSPLCPFPVLYPVK